MNILAHRVIVDGKECRGLTLLRVGDDGTYTAEPFTAETANTAFVDGTVAVTTANGRVLEISTDKGTIYNFTTGK